MRLCAIYRFCEVVNEISIIIGVESGKKKREMDSSSSQIQHSNDKNKHIGSIDI